MDVIVCSAVNKQSHPLQQEKCYHYHIKRCCIDAVGVNLFSSNISLDLKEEIQSGGVKADTPHWH